MSESRTFSDFQNPFEEHIERVVTSNHLKKQLADAIISERQDVLDLYGDNYSVAQMVNTLIPDMVRTETTQVMKLRKSLQRALLTERIEEKYEKGFEESILLEVEAICNNAKHRRRVRIAREKARREFDRDKVVGDDTEFSFDESTVGEVKPSTLTRIGTSLGKLVQKTRVAAESSNWWAKTTRAVEMGIKKAQRGVSEDVLKRAEIVHSNKEYDAQLMREKAEALRKKREHVEATRDRTEEGRALYQKIETLPDFMPKAVAAAYYSYWNIKEALHQKATDIKQWARLERARHLDASAERDDRWRARQMEYFTNYARSENERLATQPLVVGKMMRWLGKKTDHATEHLEEKLLKDKAYLGKFLTKVAIMSPFIVSNPTSLVFFQSHSWMIDAVMAALQAEAGSNTWNNGKNQMGKYIYESADLSPETGLVRDHYKNSRSRLTEYQSELNDAIDSEDNVRIEKALEQLRLYKTGKRNLLEKVRHFAKVPLGIVTLGG